MMMFTPMQYLQIDIATTYGLTDVTWDERLDWFKENQYRLMDLVAQADEPATYMSAVMAHQDALEGKDIGHQCGLDATASGLQILSLMAGCETSARACNLINTGQRENAYKLVFAAVQEVIPDQQDVAYKPLKQALMTHLYGSKKVPKDVFGERTPALAAFYDAVDRILPGANTLNHDLLSLWDPEAYTNEWTMPDGFDVVIKVMDNVEKSVIFGGKVYPIIEKVNQPVEKGLSLGANVCHSIDGMIVREMGRRCSYSAEKIQKVFMCLQSPGGKITYREKDLALMRTLELLNQSGFMSAVAFEFIDEHNVGLLSDDQHEAVSNLIESIPDNAFDLLCVHDCFKFHCNYGNDVRQQYINILAELADSNILRHIASQLTGKDMPVKKLSNNLGDLIRESEYAIC